MIEITDQLLDRLRTTVASHMSQKRLAHTLAVENMVSRLCALYCPEETLRLCAAALLHDVTKELSTDSQVALCKRLGLDVTETDILSPKTFHARTAAALIPVEFPEFAHPTVVSAVRWHTTGHKGMTLTEKLLYLADYIDDTRTFENCVILRDAFWGADPQAMGTAERTSLLNTVLLRSYDMTVTDLLNERIPIAIDTMEARNELVVALKT